MTTRVVRSLLRSRQHVDALRRLASSASPLFCAKKQFAKWRLPIFEPRLGADDPRAAGPPRASSPPPPSMGSSSSKAGGKKKKKPKKPKKTPAATTPAGAVTEVDRQVLGLKTQRRKLTAHAKRVDDAIARETAIASKAAKEGTAAGRSAATRALRRRRLQTQMSTRVFEWLMRVEELLSSIEEAQATAVVVERLRQGNEALKRAQAGYSLDDVNAVLEGMEDAREHNEAVDRMMAAHLNAEDDEAVEEELRAMEAEETREREARERADAREEEERAEVERELPAIPSEAPVAAAEEEDAEEEPEPEARRAVAA
eukprot:31439-Pelagococcus_subviridis.AAC.9